MIRNVKLQNWGIFRNPWHSPPLESLVDILGENGSGKSTLIDAISVALGLTHPSFLFDNRSPKTYVNDGKEAMIAILVDNDVLPSGKRRFPNFTDAQVTVAARVRPTHSPVCTFLMVNGEHTLEHICEVTRGWLSATEYERLWQKAGLPKEQRRQRIFRVHDIKTVEDSDSRQLDQLFREYCSDPEANDKLAAAQDEVKSAKRNLAIMNDTLLEDKRETMRVNVELDQSKQVKRQFEHRRRQEAQFLVATFHEAEHQYKRLCRQLDEAEREAAERQAKQSRLEAQMEEAQRLYHRAKLVLDQHQKSQAKAEERFKALDQAKLDAHQMLTDIKRAQARRDTLKATCRTRGDIETDIARSSDEKEAAHSQLAVLMQRLGIIEPRIKALDEHGMPVEVVRCLEALEDAEVAYESVDKYLPRDKPQGYEEALGRARFGLLVAEPDLAKTMVIAQDHRYPGPLSTLTGETYAKLRLCNVSSGCGKW